MLKAEESAQKMCLSPDDIDTAMEVIAQYFVDPDKALELIKKRAMDTSAPFRPYDAAQAACAYLARQKMISISDIKPYIGSVQYTADVSGRQIQRFIDDQREQEGIDLDPDFQRGHVWSPSNQTRYLEHLLRGGTASRTIIWNCPGYDASKRHLTDADAPKEMVIVDGKQRLTAILGFLNNEVPVFEGHFFDNFDEDSKRQILSPTGKLRLQMAIHSLYYRHELLQLYIELNEGAIAHTPEEIARVKALRDAAQPKV